MDNILDNSSFGTNPEANIVFMESIWKAITEEEFSIFTDPSATSSGPESEAATASPTLTMEDIWKIIEEDSGLSDPSADSSGPKEVSLDKDKVLANIWGFVEEDLILMKSKVDLDATSAELGDSWKTIEDDLGITDLKDELQTKLWKLIEDELLLLLLFSNLPTSGPEDASAGTELKDVWKLIEDDVIGPFLTAVPGSIIRNE
jgi:hypothetical protein